MPHIWDIMLQLILANNYWQLKTIAYTVRGAGMIFIFEAALCKMCQNIDGFHHHHHIVLAARISLTLSRHSSLSFIALGRSSGQQPVSSHSCWMYVRAGRPAFARPCVGIHKSTSLMSSSLLLQQCPACLVRLTWIVFEGIVLIYVPIYLLLHLKIDWFEFYGISTTVGHLMPDPLYTNIWFVNTLLITF